MQFCKKLETLRKTKKMTQDFLADKLGVSRQTIYKWEAGENKPEVEKLVTISKIFDVSLDVLLNDDIDIADEVSTVATSTPKPIVPTFRDVFVSKYGLHKNQSGHDHYCPEGYKGFNNGMDEAFQNTRKSTENQMKRKGYTDTIPLRSDVAVYFFIDQKNQTFGIYGNHREYFVCPFENFISATPTGGGHYNLSTPRKNVGLILGSVNGVSVSNSTTTDEILDNNYKLEISYFKKNGSTARYTVPFDFETLYLACDKHIMDLGFSEYINLSNGFIQVGAKNMQRIVGLLNEIKVIAEHNKLKNEQLPPVNVTQYVKNEEAGKQIYTEQLNDMTLHAKKHNRMETIKSACLYGIIAIGAIALICIIISAL